MSGLFINYRREDTAPYAGRIYDFLHRAFPNNKVFMDIDAIDPGEDFVDAINKTLAESKIVIAVIGPNWVKVTDAQGNRRLENPDDYVVRELAAALDGNARVIPVLVGGAAMPGTDMLPPRLQALARRHAIEVSDTRFVADAERLKGVISRLFDAERKVDPVFCSKCGSLNTDGTSFCITCGTALAPVVAPASASRPGATASNPDSATTPGTAVPTPSQTVVSNNPVPAVVLSFLLGTFGAGQFFNRDWKKGLVMLAATLILAIVVGGASLFHVAVWIWSMVDAWLVARGKWSIW